MKCADCGAETIVYVNGIPLCPICDDKREATLRKPGSSDAGPKPSKQTHSKQKPSKEKAS
jgi:hypothetical protein